jgi:hypothetical protein
MRLLNNSQLTINNLKTKTMKFTGNNQHQGDVQIFSINSLPKKIKKIDKTFIAKSEKSGHAHALCGDYDLYEVEGGHVIEVGSDGCTLNHTAYQNLTPEYWDKNAQLQIADHKPTVIEPGIYFVGIQQRKKHFSKVWEKVID